MIEEGKVDSPAAVRRGLPRRPGEQVAPSVRDVPGAGSIVETEAPKSRRSGLPRTAGTPVPEAALAVSVPVDLRGDEVSQGGAPAAGRRSGLPRSTAMPSTVNPDLATSDVVNPVVRTSMPAAEPSLKQQPPRVRRPWFLLWVGLGLLGLLAVVVLFARWFVSLDFVQDFLVVVSPGVVYFP